MTDRWNPLKTIVDTPGPPPKFYVPSGVSTLPSTVTEHPAGFRVRLRGDHESLIKHAYRCPEHGEVEVYVPRGDVPDEVPCPVAEVGADSMCTRLERVNCGRAALWAGAACAIGISSGMVTC